MSSSRSTPRRFTAACCAVGFSLVGCASKNTTATQTSVAAVRTPQTATNGAATTTPPTSAAPNQAPPSSVAPGDVAASHRVTVAAVGEARGVPDSVTVAIGVETVAPTTAEVLKTLSEKSNDLIAFLRESGIPEENLQTTNLTAYPTYGEYLPGGATPAIVGYVAGVTVNVQADDLDKASTLIDGAAFTVGDALRVQGLSWSIRDRDALLATARADAVAHAREQAGQFAAAAGWTLGAIVSIDETVGAYPFGQGDMSGGYPLNPGSHQLQVNVTVVFDATE